MQSAYAESGEWAVEANGTTTDGFIVTVRSSSLYLYFSCSKWQTLRAASEFLASPSLDTSLQIGSFCGDLSVELDCFSQEPDVVYLSVTRPEEQSMAHCLGRRDCDLLAIALSSVVDALSKLGGCV